MGWQDRTAKMLGEEAVRALNGARVAVFGLGGVGGNCMEALVRAGVGHLTLIDADTVDETNLNRQLIATRETVGRDKTEAAKERALSINPGCDVTALKLFYGAETADAVDMARFDYVADCIDSVSSKLLLIEKCMSSGTKIISCMGTGNKVHPEMLEIADITKTSVCPLARVMRRELKARGIAHLTVLFSAETPLTGEGGRTPGSVSFVPSCAGIMMAGHIIRDILQLTH